MVGISFFISPCFEAAIVGAIFSFRVVFCISLFAVVTVIYFEEHRAILVSIVYFSKSIVYYLSAGSNVVTERATYLLCRLAASTSFFFRWFLDLCFPWQEQIIVSPPT